VRTRVSPLVEANEAVRAVGRQGNVASVRGGHDRPPIACAATKVHLGPDLRGAGLLPQIGRPLGKRPQITDVSVLIDGECQFDLLGHDGKLVVVYAAPRPRHVLWLAVLGQRFS
jgi:hypothetical protein